MAKIVITGGHLTPALALIEELKAKKNELVFFGRKNVTEGGRNLSAEYREVTKRNIKFVNITGGRLPRKFNGYYYFLSLLKIPVGFLQAIYFLIIYRPKLIVSFGGYLSTPVVTAAILTGTKSITHEQASVPGLANKINSYFAKRVFVTWPSSLDYFPKSKTEVIGNLVRSAIYKKSTTKKNLSNFLQKANKLIFVSGGNQGSHFLNNLIFENIENLGDYDIIHQIGTANYKGDHEKAEKIRGANYLALDYIEAEDVGAVFTKSIIVISRSGANTVWDLAILAKCAILTPLPHSAFSEQQQNAQILQKAGSAVVIDQDEWTSRDVKAEINKFAKNLPEYQKAADKFAKTLPTDAAKRLALYVQDEISQ